MLELFSRLSSIACDLGDRGGVWRCVTQADVDTTSVVLAAMFALVAFGTVSYLSTRAPSV